MLRCRVSMYVFAIGEHKLPSDVQLLLIFSSHFGLICMPLFKYVSLNMIEIGSSGHRLIVCDGVSVHRLDLIQFFFFVGEIAVNWNL